MVGIDSRIDLDGLRQLYKGNQAARALLDHFAERERNRKETPVHRLLSTLPATGDKPSRAQVIQVLKKLEDFGCGRFVVGRHGAKSRFVWRASLVSVAQAASGELDEVESAPEDNGSEDTAMIDHAFQLRRDTTVTITLPADLTVVEAVRLADFLKTLPFER